MSVGELGMTLKEQILVSPSKIGNVARLIAERFSQQIQRGATNLAAGKNLVPLPLYYLSAEDMDIALSSHPAARKVSDFGKDRKRVKPLYSHIKAWVFLIILAINYMHTGTAYTSLSECSTEFSPSEAQLESITRIHLAACDWLHLCPSRLPDIDWDKEMAGRRLHYDGEVVAKAEDLTWEKVEAGLPPIDLTAKVPAIALAEGDLLEILKDPEKVAKPRSQWPDKLRKAKVRANDKEWELLAKGLHVRGICGLVEEDELIMHHGDPLLSGAFGVSKGKQFTNSSGEKVDILRLIINLIPANELQEMVVADILTLPHFSLWSGLELLEEEWVCWDAEDLKCAFYLFVLPDAWKRWFALGRPLRGTVFGKPANKRYYLGVRVIPMGWQSASGLCQYIQRRLQKMAPPIGGGFPASKELRKDLPLPSDEWGRVYHFYQTYLDNIDEGRVLKGVCKEPGPSPLHRALSAAFKAWQITTNSSKAINGASEGATLGAETLGHAGLVWPGEDKCLKAISCALWCLCQEKPTKKSLASGGGLWLFLLQFRRCFMPLLCRFWTVLEFWPEHRSFYLADEFLSLLCAIPLLRMDLRLSCDSLTTCSDASEWGAGVCYATTITEQGRDALGGFSRQVGGPGRDEVGLIELFGGIGGGRRALEILGVGCQRSISTLRTTRRLPGWCMRHTQTRFTCRTSGRWMPRC